MIGAEAQRHAACCELIDSVARSSGTVRLKVTGSSMLPVIWPGDEITVVHCKFAELRKSQIVLYCQKARMTAHRIEQIAHDHLVTRGDSLSTYDSPVQPYEIAGRVVSILRNGRNIQPEHSSASRIVSMMLRRSNLSRRIALHLIRRMGGYRSQFMRDPDAMQVS